VGFPVGGGGARDADADADCAAAIAADAWAATCSWEEIGGVCDTSLLARSTAASVIAVTKAHETDQPTIGRRRCQPRSSDVRAVR